MITAGFDARELTRTRSPSCCAIGHTSARSSALPEIELDAPQGRCRIDRDSNDVYCRPRIGRATDNGTFTLIEEANEMVKPDPYLIAYA